MPEGVVFNIQKYSLHDGPGIRTTVFLKGCPLRCWWCHNPESQAADPEVRRSVSRCVRCGQCLEACPQRDGQASLDESDPDDCLQCGACVEACPTGARQLIGQRMSVDDVMATIEQDRIFYDQSGGGVTFSGGEPLAQPEFLAALLDACHRKGLHTAIDTCGFAPERQLLNLAQQADLILYDLKTLDDQLHEQFTGASNRLILDNLRALARVHGQIWIRMPILPGWNDRPDDLRAAARFVADLSGVNQLHLLPYHAMHEHKLPPKSGHNGRCRNPLDSPRVKTPSPEQMAELAQIFQAEGIRTVVGG
jgi:pyruvate formate lyase activating enzyme